MPAGSPLMPPYRKLLLGHGLPVTSFSASEQAPCSVGEHGNRSWGRWQGRISCSRGQETLESRVDRHGWGEGGEQVFTGTRHITRLPRRAYETELWRSFRMISGCSELSILGHGRSYWAWSRFCSAVCLLHGGNETRTGSSARAACSTWDVSASSKAMRGSRGLTGTTSADGPREGIWHIDPDVAVRKQST